MTDLDLAALRTTAENATPGPWEASLGWFNRDCPKDCDHPTHSEGPAVFARSGEVEVVDEWHTVEENAAHIAAFNPSTALQLLNRLEAAEATIQRVRNLAEEATERAYFDIALDQMLTIQTTAADRAKVPPHWRDKAEAEAHISVATLRAALGDQLEDGAA